MTFDFEFSINVLLNCWHVMCWCIVFTIISNRKPQTILDSRLQSFNPAEL